MTKPPLERAARALCELDGNPADATMNGKPLWQSYLAEVGAVIAALREPDEALLRAGEEMMDGYSPGSPVDLIWKSMIDQIITSRQ